MSVMPENAPLDGIDHALSADRAFLAGWFAAVATSCMSCSLPPPSPTPGCDLARLDAADVTFLIEALGATSERAAESAYEILMAGGDLDVGSRVAAGLAQMPADRRKNAAIVAITNDADPPAAAERFLDQDDPVLRSAAAAAAAMLAGRGDLGP